MKWVLAAALALGGEMASAHGWYDGECCSEVDCRQTTLGEVERQPTGWFVVPLKTMVPYQGDDRLRRSLDPLIHICLYSQWEAGARVPKLRCLYVPEIAG